MDSIGKSSTRPATKIAQNALAIVERKENLPKELSIIIENYERNRKKKPSAFQAFLMHFIHDIYQWGFKWCPRQMRIALEVFPNVLPNAFTDTTTDQHIRDKEKVVSVLEKKNDLPQEIRKAIGCFRGDVVVSDSTIPRQFLVYVEESVCSLVRNESQRSQCQYDPHEFETMVRLFPNVLKYVHGLVDGVQNPKALFLLPMLLQLGYDLGTFWDYDPTYRVLRRLILNTRLGLTEKDHISVLDDIINRKLLSKEEVLENEFDVEKFSWWAWGEGKDQRYRYLVTLIPVESREQYYEGLMKFIRDQCLDATCVLLCRFRRHLDACLYWFPTEMGRLFLDKENAFLKLYHEHVSECDPIVFELLELHLAKATQQTRLNMMAYAASNELVPRKFLHLLVRREVQLLGVNGFACPPPYETSPLSKQQPRVDASVALQQHSNQTNGPVNILEGLVFGFSLVVAVSELSWSLHKLRSVGEFTVITALRYLLTALGYLLTAKILHELLYC